MAVAFVADVGGANNKTSGTTLATTVTSNVAVGTLLMVFVSADNLSATTPTFTFSDSAGNTYTTLVQKATNATAASGIAGAIGATLVSAPLTGGSSTVTVTLSGAVTAKISEVLTFSGASTVGRVAAVSASGASTAPTVTTGSASSGDLVVGLITYEDSSLLSAADADTTGGSWSTVVNAITAGGGGAATNAAISVQYKVVNAAGAQTFNNTLATSTDWNAMAVVLKPSVVVTASGSGVGTQSATVPPVSFTDDFTRANSTTSVGGDWTQSGVVGIDTNAAYLVSGASGSATQPIQGSGRKQVVRASYVATTTTSAMTLYIAYQDSNNWVGLQRVAGFATWNLCKTVAGVFTNLGNTGLSATADGWVVLVRDGDKFYGSVVAAAGTTPSRTAEFTITGMTGNGVGFFLDVAGTSYKWDNFTARPLVVATATATGSGVGTQSAVGSKSTSRTATGSGVGTAAVTSSSTRQRTATATGTGTSTAARVTTRARTATATGVGTQTATRTRSVLRTASATGTGTSTATGLVGAAPKQRTATGNGTGTSTATRTYARVRTATANGTGTAVVARTVIKTRTATASGAGTAAAVPSRRLAADATASGVGVGVAVRVVSYLRSGSAQGTSASYAISERIFNFPVPIQPRQFRKRFYPPPSKPVGKGKPLQPPRVRW